MDSPQAEAHVAPRWLHALGLLVTALTVSLWAWSPMLSAFPRTQNGDGQFFHRIAEAARWSVVHYGEFPRWNAFECGGVPLWDNPQSIIAAPLLWLAMPFGVTRAMEFWYVVHSALGFIGMWLFARSELRLTRLAAFAATTLWTFAGFHQHHYSGGHAAFVAFLYLPFAILLWRRAADDLRMAVGLGLLVAWMIFEGAVYPLPHLGLFLAAESLTRAWPPRRFAKILRAAAVVGVVAFLVGAARFLPVLDQLASHNRNLGPEDDFLKWSTFTEMFTIRQHGRHVGAQTYVWTEYASYVGPVCLVLAALGVVVAGLEQLWMLALLLLAAALMMGHFAHLAPWSILHGHVFPFKQMRVPSRFRLEVTLFLVSFAGLAIDRTVPALEAAWSRLRLLPPPGPRWAAWRHALGATLVAFGLMAAGDVIGVAMDVHGQFFGSAPVARVEPSPRLYFGGAGLTGYLDQPRQNRGRLDCWDEWGFGAGAPLWEGDVPQARPAPKADAKVEVANRTQNTFTVDVDAHAPSRILINSTYDKGWRTDVGTTSEENKQLVLHVPPGRHRVHLTYWPKTLTLGLTLSCFGLVGVVVFFVRMRRRPVI